MYINKYKKIQSNLNVLKYFLKNKLKIKKGKSK